MNTAQVRGKLQLWFLLAGFIGLSYRLPADVSVLTGHNDNARTGLDANETVLTPSNVNATNFGKIFSEPVDGYVYAQPLIVTNVTIPDKGVHNVLYVATEHDSVYAFDADGNAGSNAAPLWQVSFINPAQGVTTASSADVSCDDLVPEIGITSTPVIDPVTGTLFVEAKTKETTNSSTVFVQRLHALDLGTGAEKFGGPMVIQAGFPGSGDGNDGAGNVPFDPLLHLNRPALLLNGGLVYLAYASHCDNGPYHGWVIGYNAQTLASNSVFNTTPNGGDGGIWQAGGGLASDSNGNIFCITGNGTFDGFTNNDFGDSFLRLSTGSGLALADYFTPYNQQALSDADLDLGSGGPLLLPDSAGSVAHPHLLVGCGKQGTIYLVDRDHLGGYNSTNDNQIVQELVSVIGGTWSSPAYFNNHIYYLGSGDFLQAFPITNAVIGSSPDSTGTNQYGFPGATPSISADGTNNAIVWAIESDAFSSNGPAVLHAYVATNVAQELYNSSQADGGTRDCPGPAVKFAVPTVANGKVYVAAQYTVSVYGLSNFLDTPAIIPDSTIFTNAISITITDASPGVTLYYTLDGSTPGTNSILYRGTFVITNTTRVQAMAVKTGAVDSAVAAAVFLSNSSIGSGLGLSGAYYSDQLMTFTNPPTLVRTDATVDFDWGTGGPDASVDPAFFTVMWTGSIQPQFNEIYTFYTTTDDGVRLWVNGQLIIDEWVDQPATQWSGSIALAAGQKYPVTMEYYQNTGNASAQLAWSSPSTPMAVVPQSQLYPVFIPAFVPTQTSRANGVMHLQVSGLNGKGYVLEASTNLLNWTLLQTNSSFPDPNVALPTNLFNFSDTTVTNYPRRFYRAFQQP